RGDLLGSEPLGRVAGAQGGVPTGAVLGAGVTAAPAAEAVPAGGRRAAREDDGAVASRRSASLEDAEPVRRGRRAAPDDDDSSDVGALRPGDVAEGKIAF